jgi:hypothetical protein
MPNAILIASLLSFLSCVIFFLFCWNCRIEEADRGRQLYRPEIATFRQESGDKMAGRYVECRIPDGTIGRALGNSYFGKKYCNLMSGHKILRISLLGWILQISRIIAHFFPTIPMGQLLGGPLLHPNPLAIRQSAIYGGDWRANEEGAFVPMGAYGQCISANFVCRVPIHGNLVGAKKSCKKLKLKILENIRKFTIPATTKSTLKWRIAAAALITTKLTTFSL